MKYLFLGLFCIGITLEAIKIEIIPDDNRTLYYPFCKIEDCFNPHIHWNRRLRGLCYHYALSHGGTCRLTDYKYVNVNKKVNNIDADVVLVWNISSFVPIGKFKVVPKKKQYLFLFEPSTVLPIHSNPNLVRLFNKIFTWDDGLVDNKNYFKMRYPVLCPPIEKRIPFSEKKLCCMIVGNKNSSHPQELYSKRRSIIQALDKRGDFDLYGTGWEGTKYKCYKGPVDDKIEVASHYKFSFAIENMGWTKGYITEKIFDALASLSVPIYQGASNIGEEIPENCFIDLTKFSNIDELMNYLTSMSQERYNEYIENILAFLKSDQAKKYSVEAFFENIKREIFTP